MKFVNRTEANKFYADFFAAREKESPESVQAAMAHLGRRDLFFLLVRILHREDINHDWLFARCKEVRLDPYGYLDLWAREHYKSTIITFGHSVQEIINDPEVTIGIFSHTRPIAKGFLRQIKQELETNTLLHQLYPDIFWEFPRKQAPKWSEDDGIVVKRKSNPNAQTVEAWGLVDGQPTSKHFKRLKYDDVVTKESVTTPAMIEKVTDALALSYNLGAHGGTKQFIGTRYHFNDTYKTVMARKTAIPRIYPATHDGTTSGKPVFLSPESLAEKRRDMGPYVFGCQMLQDPRADEVQGFQKIWLKFWSPTTTGLNLYLLVDPASSKKKASDYTVMMIIGLGPDKNYYVVDFVRDRLNLSERSKQLFDFHSSYSPLRTGYEKYGKDSDIEHLQEKMADNNYRFDIIELGGKVAKEDRIKRLIPLFEQGRIYLPKSLVKSDYQGKPHDLVQEFINDEYLAFPVPLHDDMLDCLARIVDSDLEARFPKPKATHKNMMKGVYLR